jgi:putative transposase
MVKVENRRKLKWCLVHYELGEIRCKWVVKHLGVTPRRFLQLCAEYKSTGKIPDIGLNVGRPTKEVPEEWKQIIKREYEKCCSNAVYLEKTINARHKIRILFGQK